MSENRDFQLINDGRKLFKLSFSIIDHQSGKEISRHRGVYCGINVTDAQRDAVEDCEEFDDSTQVIVFDKDYIEF